ncbi:MAG TPA: TlpA disulfide reductase family protein [Polyangia bacterium]|jgi:peroxiredoxin
MRKLVIAAALLAAGAAFANVQKGQRAPEFSLPSLKGSTVTLSSMKGKVVLVDFWAQWCEPCKKELPQLDRLAKEYAQKGVVIVAVNIDKQRENAERMVKQLGVSLPVLLDPAGSVAGTYDLPKMPTSFVIDKKGIVRFVNEGFDGPKDVDRFKQELDELTKQ